MMTTTGKPLTDSQVTRFFRKPATPAQRQYEALRAYFVECLTLRESLTSSHAKRTAAQRSAAIQEVGKRCPKEVRQAKHWPWMLT